jgi:hypothetical protein
MNIADLVIIYLAFGAPFAVYKYLHNRDLERGQRILSSLLTFVFWIPVAAQTGYRYFTNAYSGNAFVSQRNLDALDARLALLRESIKAELILAGCNLTVHDIREILQRYAGLAECARDTLDRESDSFSRLFEAAGRTKHEIATACLTRRNRLRLKRHSTQAGHDFAVLFEQLSTPAARKAVELGIEFANILDDNETASRLTGLIEKRGEVWNSEQQKPVPSTISAVVSPIAMTTASLNRD